jgi:hypothetical protein
MIKCTVCKTLNPDGARICSNCGVVLSSGSIQANGMLELRVMGEENGVVRITAPNVEGCVLGRSDAKSDYTPDVDFMQFQAREKGVSRRHAVLVSYRQTVHVIDLSSINGTFLNGTRLTPEVPYPLSNGDQLSLANLHLIIAQVSK